MMHNELASDQDVERKNLYVQMILDPATVANEQSGISNSIYNPPYRQDSNARPRRLVSQLLFNAFHATRSLLNFGTVALPALTLYLGFLSTLPIST